MDTQNTILAQHTYEQLAATLATLPPDVAVARIEQFLHDQPDHAQAHNDVGVLQYQLGNKLQTLGRYERAVKLAPQNTTFKTNLASFYFVELGWVDDAIQIYTDLLQQNPADIETLSALALISTEIGQQHEARIFLERIITLQPWNQDAAAMLAALDGTVNSAPAATGLAESPVVDCQSEMDLLLSELKQSIAGLTDSLPEPPVTRPNDQPAEPSALESQIAELQAQLSTDPANALIHNNLGVLFLEKGDQAQSLAHHELACRYAPANLTFLKNLAGVCAANPATLDQAIELLTTALAKNPVDTELLAALGQVSLQCGRPEEALIFLRRILDFEPWNQEVRSIVIQLQNCDPGDFFLSP